MRVICARYFFTQNFISASKNHKIHTSEHMCIVRESLCRMIRYHVRRILFDFGLQDGWSKIFKCNKRIENNKNQI